MRREIPLFFILYFIDCSQCTLKNEGVKITRIKDKLYFKNFYSVNPEIAFPHTIRFYLWIALGESSTFKFDFRKNVF